MFLCYVRLLASEHAGMSVRKHPGRLSTKSGPNAWDGVTKPNGTGSEVILAAISSALFAVKS
jgi:hypothetical protein